MTPFSRDLPMALPTNGAPSNNEQADEGLRETLQRFHAAATAAE
jgi:hypothetical protein